MKFDNLYKKCVVADVDTLIVDLPQWMENDNNLLEVSDKIYVYDHEKRVFDALCRYITNNRNAVICINDFIDKISGEGNVVGENISNVRDLTLDFFAKRIDEPFWNFYLSSSSANEKEFYVIFKDPNKKVYPVIINRIKSFLTKYYLKLNSEKTDMALPTFAAITKKFKLEQADIPLVFQRLKISDISYSSKYDFFHSNKILVFEFTTSGKKLQIILPPQLSLEQIVHFDMVSIIKPFFNKYLVGDSLAKNTERINKMYKKTFSTKQISQQYNQLLQIFEESSKKSDYNVATYLSTDLYYRLIGFYIRVDETTSSGKITNVIVVLYFLYYYLYNSFNEFNSKKKEQSTLSDDKHAIIKSLAQESSQGTSYGLLTSSDILDFQDSERKMTIRDKYFGSDSTGNVSNLESLLPLQPSPNKRVNNFPEIEDKIPLCITVKVGGIEYYVSKWTWIYVLQSELKLERIRLMQDLATKWENDLTLFQQQMKKITITREEVSPRVNALIDKSVELRNMYSMTQLANILIPDEKELFIYDISVTDQFFSKNILRKGSSKVALFKLLMEDALFKIPGDAHVTLKNYTEIFEISFKDVVNSSNHLKSQTGLPVKLKILILKLFKNFIPKEKPKKKIKLSSQKKADNSSVDLQTVARAKAYREKSDRIVKLYAEGGPISELFDILFKEFVFAPDDQMKKKPSFNTALNENIIIYDKEANYCYLTNFALNALWEDTVVKNYFNNRIKKIKEYIKKFEVNQKNKFVIVDEQEKAYFPHRKKLLVQFLMDSK